MAEEWGTEGAFRRLVRGCIYNRWFYAFLSAVCLLDVATDVWVLVRPRTSILIDVISLIASAITAVLVTTVFVDLQFRRRKP
jgi:hypothetical protein